jgi:hypothetical protein
VQRVSYFEVAARYDERLREAEIIRRNARAARNPGWMTRLVAAIGLRQAIVSPAT